MAEKKKGFDLTAVLGEASKLDTGRTDGRDQIEYIDIAHIEADSRNFYELHGIEKLSASIELVGLQQPLRVRPFPGQPGYYIIISGHRRHAALSLLVEQGKQQFAEVPCIVEKGSSHVDPALLSGVAADQAEHVEELLQELKLIYGNSDTRKISPADLSRQAERVEMLFYELKEAGMEFPGKMRDHVAQACKVSASKLARLKVIRERLIPALKVYYDKGQMNESVAYACAQQPDDVQKRLIEYSAQNRYYKTPDTWYLGAVQTWVGYIDKLDAATCQKSKGDQPCANKEQMLKYLTTGRSEYEGACAKGGCCDKCSNLATCKYACPMFVDKIQDLRKDKKAQRAREKELEEEQSHSVIAQIKALWERFGHARAMAGKSIDECCNVLVIPKSVLGTEDEVMAKERLEAAFNTSTTLPYGYHCTLIEVQRLIQIADLLGCSIDYLLCRTDAPQGFPAASVVVNGGGWIPATTPPPKGSRVLAYFDLGDGKSHRAECDFDGTDYLMRNAKVEMPPIRWLLIPPVEDEADE